jgi:hypothetical protein
MAFSTRAELRARLNEQLGTSDGNDKPWGSVDARNSAIRWALEQLEPSMMRFLEESITIAAGTREYTLTSAIAKVALVEVTDTNGHVRDRLNYRSITIDTDPPTTRLTFAQPLPTDWTLRVSGYAPHLSDLSAETTECDVPQELEWIVLLGATAELYRRRFHEWIDFEQYNASNPSTAIDPEVIYRAYTDALGRFEQAKRDHYRKVSMPRRARFARG